MGKLEDDADMPHEVSSLIGGTEVSNDAPSTLISVVLCSIVAVSYTAAAVTSTKIQRGCHYQQSFLITYLNEVFFFSISMVMLSCCRPSRADVLCMLRTQTPWALLLSPLSLGANVTFAAALRLTSTASAVTLEQLTTLFVACLSCLLLKVSYRLWSLPFLLMAVSGAVLATLGDTNSMASTGGRSRLSGDVLCLLVAFLVGLHMVLFKFAFPKMQPQELILFMSLNSLVTVSYGWAILLALDRLGWEHAKMPHGCAKLWLPIGAVFSGVYSLALICTTVKIAPLTARLSVLLAIPFSFVIDLIAGHAFKPQRFLGVVLIFLGVLGFESLSKPSVTSNAQCRIGGSIKIV